MPFISKINGIDFSASYAATSSQSQTASLATTSLLALTASYINALTQNVDITGSLTILNNLTVLGSQSINYITSSQLNISTNLITVNTSTPSVRFGGIAVRDSGSLATGLTGSLLWDSQNDVWLYSNPSGSTYDGALMLVGPRNSTGLGNEVGINSGYAAVGNGSHHMTSSAIYSSGSLIRLENNTQVTGSLNVSGGITGSLFGTASWAIDFVSASNYVLNSVTSSFVTNNQTSSFVQNSQTSSMSVATASYINPLNQDVTITGTLTVGGEISGIQGQVTALAMRNYLFSGF